LPSTPPEYLAKEGVETVFEAEITGYENQKLPIHLVLVDEDHKGRIELRDKSITITPKRGVDSYSSVTWLPLPARPGRYRVRFEIYEPDMRPGDSPKAQASTPPFRWSPPGPVT
jgi:hypothetical protein